MKKRLNGTAHFKMPDRTPEDQQRIDAQAQSFAEAENHQRVTRHRTYGSSLTIDPSKLVPTMKK